ncbi:MULTISPECIES: hypothetical protein [unclassified Levilactobacillus]|uniref:hypothetical protein n=1 Tax=unclassified Levilactobacillus TaxID=2767918 RepID=UPI002FF1C269
MTITEAARLASKNGRGIAIRNLKGVHFIPTNGSERTIIVSYSKKNRPKLTAKWEPSLDDLTRNDWIVY